MINLSWLMITLTVPDHLIPPAAPIPAQESGLSDFWRHRLFVSDDENNDQQNDQHQIFY